MMKKAVYTLLLIASMSSIAHSQSTVGINLQGFLPTGELKKDAPELGGLGLGFEGIFTVKQSPFHIGAILEFNHFGSQSREGYHGPDLGDVRVKRNFETFKALSVFRFKPNCGENIYPYFDLLIGAGNIYTRTNIRESFFEEPYESYFDIDKWAFMYGIGIGNEFFLSDKVILDVFFRTIKSNRIEYLSPKSIEFDPSTNWYNFEVKSSAFDHINFGLGFKFLFTELLRGY